MEEKKPEEESLEAPDTSSATADGIEENSLESVPTPEVTKPVQATLKKRGKLSPKNLVSKLNIYMLLFILIVIVVAGITFVGYQRNQKNAAPEDITTTPLTQESLDELRGSDAQVGDPKQILSVESNAVFAGKVLVRDSVDIAGTLKTGGNITGPGIAISGTGTFDQLQSNGLSVGGDTNIQGQLSVQRNLTVNGNGSFSGAVSVGVLSVQNLQIAGDLQFNRHIDAGGGNPSKVDGGALGAGGTSSLSGTDTAGTATVNTGSNPPAGCFMTITFNQSFNSTPHIAITPVGSAAGGLNYYVTRTASSFSLCTTNSAPQGATFSFDYIIID